MKYGDTLRQRSIPAWQTHNIDYQDIKQYIKENTTQAKGKAVTIPGAADTNAAEFENTLFHILKEQDDRITWFVKSKVGEIHRRLAHLEQQIAKITRRQTGLLPDRRDPARQLQRYGKIETDILRRVQRFGEEKVVADTWCRVGDEIQDLSRFIGVQVTAFRKLIKKYNKWTGSSELGYRFEDEVRQRRSTFASTDLKPFLERYTELLHSVRALYEQSQSTQDTRPKTPNRTWPDRSSTSANARLSHVRFILEKGKRVDFDHLIATLKLGDYGKNAVFWVHPENIIELSVLLMQFTRSFNACCRQPSSSSAASSQANSPRVGQSFAEHPDTFDIIVDDAHNYLVRQAAETVGATEALPEAGTQRAALHARGNGKDDVSLLAWNKDSSYGASHLETCAMKRKFVDTILNRGSPVLSRKASIPHLSSEGGPVPDSTESVESLQDWLRGHTDASPITSILSQRSRFFNVSSDNTGAVLAALDHQIQFQQGAWTETDGWPASKFPHAVLRIRQEGAQVVDLIQVLDHSHLVERVHGFSLEHHAIWQANQPKDVSPPFWIPLLDQDLRKVPTKGPSSLHKASTEFGSQSTTPQMSTATSSEAGGQTTDSQIASKGKGKQKKTAAFTEDELAGRSAGPAAKPNKKSKQNPSPVQQYWNEYDHPSDDEDGGYVIYVDPNEKSIFETAWDSFTSLFRPRRETGPETRPLLYNPDLEVGGSQDGGYESSSSDEDDDDNVRGKHRHSRVYGQDDTAATGGTGLGISSIDAVKGQMMSVPKFTLTCFTASVTILIVAFVLAASGRKKLSTQVDAGVLFAVGASLVFSVVGVASLYRSGEHLRGAVWAAAGVTLCVVAVASGGLVAWVIS